MPLHADRAAMRAIEALVDGGAGLFEPGRHLPRLIPIAPSAVAEAWAPARRLRLARLIRALRAERQRGRAGHWTYDLNRHIALMQAYAAEKRAFAACRARNGNA